MEIDIEQQHTQIIEKIVARQDRQFRWAFDKNQARRRPELRRYFVAIQGKEKQ